MNQTQNPYETLGVPPTATADEIKKAFRSKSKEFHPDKCKDDGAKMKEVNAAYEILSDPAKRANYDATGSTQAFDIPSIVAGVFESVILERDPVSAAKQRLSGGSETLTQNIRELKKNADKLMRSKAALKFNGDGENALTTIFDIAHAKTTKRISELESSLKLTGMMIEYLDQYGFDAPPSQYRDFDPSRAFGRLMPA